jgi:hypothetical protein
MPDMLFEGFELTFLDLGWSTKLNGRKDFFLLVLVVDALLDLLDVFCFLGHLIYS